MKTRSLALAGVAIVAIGTAGYFGNEALFCKGLETDYLNAFSDYRANIQLSSISSTPEFEATAKELENMSMQHLALTYSEIYDQCGERAADTARRKATDAVLSI